MVIINDLHAGVKRVGGTTPTSSLQLKQYLVDRLHDLLELVEDDICVLGDLFDSYAVDLTTVKMVGKIFRDWMSTCDHKLILVRGNHDYSNNVSHTGSLDFLAWMLGFEFGDRVQYVTKPEFIDPTRKIYVIPHVKDQETFNECVGNIPRGTKFLLLHCNYDNHFAVDGDHSLNLSEEQAQKLLDRNMRIGFGHEHPKRQPHEDVFVFGNQFPSSIADCKGIEAKYYHQITSDYSVKEHECWHKDEFIEVDWRVYVENGFDYFPKNDVNFVRVVGECSSAESAQAIRVVSDFRKKSDAFVVSNAVSVAGVMEMDELPTNMEDAKNFDAMEVLFELLSKKQVKKIKEVMA